jgi:anti-sigma B factor antagonist
MHTTLEALGRDTVVIRVHGDLDAFAAPELKMQLFAALDTGFDRVVLEMSECDFVDSTGLGVLVAGLKRARGREVVMACPTPDVLRVLEIVGLDRVLPVCGSRAEALRRVRSA